VTQWLPYVWAAIAAATIAGFGFGTAAFAMVALGWGAGPWWPALVQAHGHLQLFGWGGLMVLGVGFFFLPRLRGAPLAHPALLPWVLGLMGAGLAVRAVAQPASGIAPGGLVGAALAVSGMLELAGVTLAVVVLAATAREGPPLKQRTGLVPVFPYLVVSFGALWLALALNAAALIRSAWDGAAMVPSGWENAVVFLGLDWFLVSVSVAVSARSFPLFLWLRVPSSRGLRLALWPFLVGLTLRLFGSWFGVSTAAAAGALLEGASLIAFGTILSVVPVRRREGGAPRGDVHYIRPVEYLLVPAYIWLAVTGLLQIGMGLSLFGLRLGLVPDLERHALGSGFVTLLILGMGQRMLPGFSGRRIASIPLVWATAVLGNAGALLRVLPLLVATLAGPAAWPFGSLQGTLALSGALGLAAVLCFAVNLRRTFRRVKGEG
jgi:uncharacterized protein involved in response to NO